MYELLEHSSTLCALCCLEQQPSRSEKSHPCPITTEREKNEKCAVTQALSSSKLKKKKNSDIWKSCNKNNNKKICVFVLLIKCMKSRVLSADAFLLFFWFPVLWAFSAALKTFLCSVWTMSSALVLSCDSLFFLLLLFFRGEKKSKSSFFCLWHWVGLLFSHYTWKHIHLNITQLDAWTCQGLPSLCGKTANI